MLLKENHSSQDDDIVHVRVAITKRDRERGLTLSRLNTAITQVRSKSVAFVCSNAAMAWAVFESVSHDDKHCYMCHDSLARQNNP